MTLYESLNTYAMESVFTRFERPHQTMLEDLRHQIDETTDRLRSFSPEAGDLAESLAACHQEYMEIIEEAYILTGISVGMELCQMIG